MVAAEEAYVITVLDLDGNPVANAAVSITEAERPVPEIAYLTGEDGMLSIRLPIGRARLEAHDALGKGSIETIVRVGDGSDRNLTIVLSKN